MDLTGLTEIREHGRPLSPGKKTLDPDRVRRTFLNYFVQARESDTAESKAQSLMVHIVATNNI